MQINCNKRKCLNKKKVQLTQGWFETLSWLHFGMELLAAKTNCQSGEDILIDFGPF